MFILTFDLLRAFLDDAWVWCSRSRAREMAERVFHANRVRPRGHPSPTTVSLEDWVWTRTEPTVGIFGK